MSKHKYRNYIAYGLMMAKDARCEKCVHWKEQYAPHPFCLKTKKNDFCGDFKEIPNCSECEHYEDHHTSLACANCPVITKSWKEGKEKDAVEKDGLCTKDNEEVSADMLCGDWSEVEE